MNLRKNEVKENDKLNLNNFVETLNISELSDEALIEILKQSPTIIGDIIKGVNDSYESVMRSNEESNNASMLALKIRLDATNDVLQDMRKKDNVPLSDIKELLEEIEKIEDKISKKDTENKKFNETVFKEKCSVWKEALKGLSLVISVAIASKKAYDIAIAKGTLKK